MNTVLKDDVVLFSKQFPLYEELKGQCVTITGATGLLGSCMTRCLLALSEWHKLGICVVAVARNEGKARRMFAEELHEGALKSSELLIHKHDFSSQQRFCPPMRKGHIIHFASPTASRFFVEQPVETMLTTLNGTAAILDFAEENKLGSVVLASSLEVYGTVMDDREPLTEERQGYINTLSARSSYPVAKRASECLCHAYAVERGVNVRIGRLAQTFGAGIAADDNRVFAQFARSIVRGDDIVMHTTGDLSRSYCYTTDAIGALLYIMLRGENGTAYNVANDETYMSVAEMARYMCREFNPNVSVRIELSDGFGYSPSTHLRLSTERMKQLGWRPMVEKREMFDRLIRSFK